MNRIVWLSNPVNPGNPAILSKTQKLSSCVVLGGLQSGRKEVRERPFFVSPSESRTTIQVNRKLGLK